MAEVKQVVLLTPVEAARRLRARGIPLPTQVLVELSASGRGPLLFRDRLGLGFVARSVDEWGDFVLEDRAADPKFWDSQGWVASDNDTRPTSQPKILVVCNPAVAETELVVSQLRSFGFHVVGPMGALDGLRASDEITVDCALFQVDETNVDLLAGAATYLLSKVVPFVVCFEGSLEIPQNLTFGGPILEGEFSVPDLAAAIRSLPFEARDGLNLRPYLDLDGEGFDTETHEAGGAPPLVTKH